MDEPSKGSDADTWGRHLQSLILDQNKGLAIMQATQVKDSETVQHMAADLAEVKDILNGNDRIGLVGLRKRIEIIEAVVARYGRWEWYARGAAVGITLNGVISIASLIITLTKGAPVP